VAELTIGAGFARALFDLAVARGASPAALTGRTGVDRACLGDLDGRIAFDAYVALMRAAKELTGDPALALHFGEEVDMMELSILPLLVGSGETSVEALVELNRFSPLAIEVDAGGADRVDFVRRDGGLFMVDRRPDPDAFPELTESTFARMVCSGRRHGYDMLKAVHVTHKAPAYRSEYDRIFQVPIVFESGWNALQVDEALMASMRFDTQPPYVHKLLNERAETLLKELEASKTLRGRVERLLVPMLPGGGSTIRAVAARLGMSRQTLYRRLKGEGVTFEQLLDNLRHRLALRYVREEGVSINEAAYRLGFADRAAFSHAFKRWTGASPKSGRQPPPPAPASSRASKAPPCSPHRR
jgi:AraC-like DNA-binding protein